MFELNKAKKIKNTKTISIIFIVYSALNFLMMIVVLLFYKKMTEIGASGEIDNIKLLVTKSTISIYFLVMGMYVYKFKKWAMHTVAYMGFIYFALSFLLVTITLYAGGFKIKYFFDLLLNTYWMLAGGYLLKNKFLFK